MDFLKDVVLGYPLSWLLIALVVIALILGIWELNRGADLLGAVIILVISTCTAGAAWVLVRRRRGRLR